MHKILESVHIFSQHTLVDYSIFLLFFFVYRDFTKKFFDFFRDTGINTVIGKSFRPEPLQRKDIFVCENHPKSCISMNKIFFAVLTIRNAFAYFS